MLSAFCDPCCSAAAGDSNETVFYTMEEEVAVFNTEGMTNIAVFQQEAAKPAMFRNQPSARSTERNHLKELLKIWTTNAQKGCPCVRRAADKHVPAEYRVDADIQHFMVVDSDNGISSDLVHPFSNLIEVYSFAHDGEQFFPDDVLENMTLQERMQLLRVVFHEAGNEPHDVFLLESSADDCKVFVTCMQILSLYSRSLPSSCSPK
mmetsp:Transcript_98111/g.184509  ORF Transcript_98111/g.184509 Transcript_98111/m.184509 type:complete len:206 (+) Transcript_98111:55-672(+)